MLVPNKTHLPTTLDAWAAILHLTPLFSASIPYRRDVSWFWNMYIYFLPSQRGSLTHSYLLLQEAQDRHWGRKMFRSLGGYIDRKTSLINIFPHHSFVKAAWWEINCGCECCGWLAPSQWFGGRRVVHLRSCGSRGHWLPLLPHGCAKSADLTFIF